MNTPLWMNISTFNLDEPISEYGFSTRLARENNWPAGFTQQAIFEYKKFMYLAATSGAMVSPSPVVDVVWHQHLIFTESYAALCSLTGKWIQHIPSTHTHTEADKFRQAADRTKELYNNQFGEQPKEIWNYETPFESLQLPRAARDFRKWTQIAIFVFAVLVFPLYYLLKPLYVHIDNPYFLYGYVPLFILVFTGLYVYNQSVLERIADNFDATAFVRHLHPAELVYLKTQDLHAVIHGAMNQLVRDGRVAVTNNRSLQLAYNGGAGSVEEITVCQAINSGQVSYPVLLRQLEHKPVFTRIAGAMDAFREYFIQSKAFGKLFYLNVCVLSFMWMLGLIRFLTGITRDKPVVLISLVSLVMLVAVSLFLRNLSALFCTSTIPNLYRTRILPAQEYAPGLDWKYFLLGTAMLSPQFSPVVMNVTGNGGSSFDGPWGGGCSSGGSADGGGSCGSGCGSSCGGCGGD